MRQLLLYGVYAISALGASTLGASWVDLPFPSIDTISGSDSFGLKTKEEYRYVSHGPRGHRGERGKRGRKGERGEPALLTPAFGEEVLILPTGGGPIPVSLTPLPPPITPPTPTNPYVVPLIGSPLNTDVGFDPTTNSLLVQASGSYLAEFFLKVFASASFYNYGPTPGAEGYVIMALRELTTNTLYAQTKLVPVMMFNFIDGKYDIVASGTHRELLELEAGMKLQLVITEVSTTIPPSPTPIEFDFIGGNPVQTSSDEVAFLTLLKVT